MFELTGTLEASESEAIVRYRFVNSSNEIVYAAQHVTDRKRNLQPASAYAALSHDGRRLDLLLGTSPVPTDRDVEFAVPAIYVKLSVGAETTGEIRMPIPVLEWDAYHPPARGPKDVKVEVREATLTLEIVPEKTLRWIQPAKEPENCWLLGGTPTPAKLSLSSDVPIVVCKRHDDILRRS